MDWSELWADFVVGKPDAVEAIGTWATVILALVGAYFVWRQIRESRRLSVEQAQPDVVAMMESNSGQPQMIELAFKNYGATPARNIEVISDVPLQRSTHDGGAELVWIPTKLPYLAPGQEWRTTWDFAPRRMGSQLKDADEHNVTITYDGLAKTIRRTSYAVLDWGAYKGPRFMDHKSVHDGARALLSIDGTLKKWTENGKHLRVLSRDGDKNDEEERAAIQVYLAEQRAQSAAAAADASAVPSDGGDTTLLSAPDEAAVK